MNLVLNLGQSQFEGFAEAVVSDALLLLGQRSLDVHQQVRV